MAESFRQAKCLAARLHSGLHNPLTFVAAPANSPRSILTKRTQIARVVVSAALGACATGTPAPGTIDNWRAADGTVWKNGSNEHCWRDAFV